MCIYEAYGLGIKSEIRLPELIVGELPVDVIIQKGNTGLPLPKPNEKGNHFHATPEYVHFYWPGEGSMLVLDGSRIILDSVQDVDEFALRLSILGPGLGAILHQRENLVLHAS